MNRPYHSRQLAFPQSKRPSRSGRPPATATGDADRSPRCPPPRRAAHVIGVAGPPLTHVPYATRRRGAHTQSRTTSRVPGPRPRGPSAEIPASRPHERVAIRRGRAPATGHRPPPTRVTRETGRVTTGVIWIYLTSDHPAGVCTHASRSRDGRCTGGVRAVEKLVRQHECVRCIDRRLARIGRVEVAPVNRHYPFLGSGRLVTPWRARETTFLAADR